MSVDLARAPAPASEDIREGVTETVRPTLQILLGAVGLLLLILGGNAANPLLPGGSGRER